MPCIHHLRSGHNDRHISPDVEQSYDRDRQNFAGNADEAGKKLDPLSGFLFIQVAQEPKLLTQVRGLLSDLKHMRELRINARKLANRLSQIESEGHVRLHSQ